MTREKEKEKTEYSCFYSNPLFNCDESFFKNIDEVLPKEECKVLYSNPNHLNSFSLMPKEELHIKTQWAKQFDPEFPKYKSNELDSRTNPFEEGGSDRNLSRSNKKTFHSSLIIMEIQTKEGSTTLALNQRTITCLPFEYNYIQLQNNNLESKMSPTLNTQDASVGWSLFGWIT